jgi:hypothetical protein
MKSFHESLNESNRDREMVDGVVNLLKMVKDQDNRKEMAEYMLKDFQKEKVSVNREDFLKRCDLK